MAGAKEVVVDASVAVKWFNREEYSESALRLLHDYLGGRIELVAPYLIIYEVCNALRYNPDFGEEDVKEAVNHLLNLQMSLRLLDRDHAARAVSLAYRAGLTLYDTVYLALAESEGAELYTSDEKLLSKDLTGKAKHIKDYGK